MLVVDVAALAAGDDRDLVVGAVGRPSARSASRDGAAPAPEVRCPRRLRRGGHAALLSCYDDMDKANPKMAHPQVVIGSSKRRPTCTQGTSAACAFGTFATCAVGSWGLPSLRVAARPGNGSTRGDTDGERFGPHAPGNPVALAGTPMAGDKGLKKNAIGFVSSVVIGVASTAPGYSLAATLGFVAAARRPAVAGDPADQLHPDVPGRRRLLLHEQSRPGLRHQLLLGDQGDGAAARLDRRLDDRRRRHHRDGQPRPDRRPLHLPALRLESAAASTVGGDRRRRRSGS